MPNIENSVLSTVSRPKSLIPTATTCSLVTQHLQDAAGPIPTVQVREPERPSPRQLSQPAPNELRRVRRLAQLLHRRRNGGRRFRRVVTEVGQGRERLGSRVAVGRGDGALDHGGRRNVEAGHRQRRRFVLKLRHDALRELLPDPRRLLDGGPVAERDRIGEILRGERAEHSQRHLGADALDGLQHAKPGAIDLAPELADHAPPPNLMRLASACGPVRWWAWQMATASASASSALSKFAFGSRKPTIAWIWRFSPWPVPVTDFLMRFGGYSAIFSPLRAGASS